MTRLDRRIFCVLIAASALAVLLTNVIFAGQAPKTVVVEVDGREYGRYSLNEKNGKTLDVRTQFGYNKIEIVSGRARVLEADCPDRLDVRAGWISSAGEMLVCLPNRLMVRIEGEKEVDGVAY